MCYTLNRQMKGAEKMSNVKTDDKKRIKYVQVRLTKDEKKTIKKDADKAHLPVSAYIRLKLLTSEV